MKSYQDQPQDDLKLNEEIDTLSLNVNFGPLYFVVVSLWNI